MGHAFSSQSFVTTAEHAELRERVAVLEEALKRPRDDEREAEREQRQRTGPPTASAAAAATAAQTQRPVPMLVPVPMLTQTRVSSIMVPISPPLPR